MRWLFVASLLCAVACRGSKAIDEKLDKLEQIKVALCACRDKACAEKQEQAYVAWKKGNTKADQDAATASQQKRFTTARDEMKKCAAKAEKKRRPAR